MAVPAFTHRREQRINVERTLNGLHMVYYVRHRGHIKIGYTASIVRRLRELGLQPTDIIAWEYGDRTLEAIRHAQFEHARVEGSDLGREHYDQTPDLLDHMADLRAAMIARTRHAETA